ncbi:Conserved_hypothetical protein [Hexamita inflata]|uniref:Transmembrane protein n=1 Tax=Hexamita inflata TaxID=28002 RepID=A0AA86VUK8_9EUKA|nr:Conserved hypothetical protein [Hexamita inflata]
MVLLVLKLVNRCVIQLAQHSTYEIKQKSQKITTILQTRFFQWLQVDISQNVVLRTITSQYDLFAEFQNDQNQVVLNQFAMFITKPHQYSIKRPKYFINYYNLLEATVCQAQQFNIELTTLLFQCGFTMMYYQIDGGKYCVMNKLLNYTQAQQCTIGDTTIQLNQIPGSGVYTVTFLSPNYQKYLNSQQYSNCFMFLDEFNSYLTQLYQNLNLKFVYFNDNIYSEDLINITAPYGQLYTLQPVYEQRKTNFSLNILVVVSVVFAIMIYSSTVNM